uniref:Uncharacterized protein n=1 Tax=Tanacetum cinerariifolium TaxID=118510 RepID=A0A6L2NWS2_TANCI|nr:hypothetical protein [Tanacetum cinerariifolium]
MKEELMGIRALDSTFWTRPMYEALKDGLRRNTYPRNILCIWPNKLRLGLPVVIQSSFDKANRTSAKSFR